MGESAAEIFTIDATDRNEDNLKYKILSGPKAISIDDSGKISWTDTSVVDLNEIENVKIAISDDLTATTFIPQLLICDCKNGGKIYFINFLTFVKL